MLIIFIAASCGSFLITIATGDAASLSDEHAFSALDIMAYINRGMDEYSPIYKQIFMIDMTWTIPLLCIAFMACTYISKDRKGYSAQIVSRTKSRVLWLTAKYLWLTVIVVLFYGSIILVSSLIARTIGGTELFTATQQGIALTSLDYSNMQLNDIALLYILFIVAALTGGCMAMTLSLIIGPVGSYLAFIVLMIASSYFKTNYLFLDFTMLARNSLVTDEGFTSAFGIAECLLLAGIFIFAGLLFVKRTDYL
ncbi:MAG: hypothetical protein LKF61_04590 [Eggerthellaceae bacterium]|nr:hypothetical protein [Eggerthellaceae bacterium]MCH4220636.1 hypothetical protein [Eggerthellaceae bacterium]